MFCIYFISILFFVKNPPSFAVTFLSRIYLPESYPLFFYMSDSIVYYHIHQLIYLSNTYLPLSIPSPPTDSPICYLATAFVKCLSTGVFFKSDSIFFWQPLFNIYLYPPPSPSFFSPSSSSTLFFSFRASPSLPLAFCFSPPCSYYSWCIKIGMQTGKNPPTLNRYNLCAFLSPFFPHYFQFLCAVTFSAP